jgi:TPR repeat protein
MGCWAVLFLVMLGTGYVDAPHPGATFEFWKKAYAEGRPNAGAKLLRITQSQAAQGIPAACNQLGLLYMNGEVIGKDRAAAGHYFATACQAGDLDGCANLSTQFLFLREARSEKDVARGLERLERECGQGRDAGSCFLIGFAYETGRGRPADPVRARQLYREGARRGSVDACKALLRIAAAGNGSTNELEDCARVLEVACERGDAESCLLLATMLHAGAGTPHDDEKARDFLRRACTLGSDAACQAIEAATLPTFSVPRAAQAPRWRESTLPAGG